MIINLFRGGHRFFASVSKKKRSKWYALGQLSLVNIAPGQYLKKSSITWVNHVSQSCLFFPLWAGSRFLMASLYAAVSAAVLLCPLVIHSPCLIDHSDLPPKPKLIGHRGAPMVSVCLYSATKYGPRIHVHCAIHPPPLLAEVWTRYVRVLCVSIFQMVTVQLTTNCIVARWSWVKSKKMRSPWPGLIYLYNGSWGHRGSTIEFRGNNL